ncbi:MAG: excinuclease ABC subunit UvrC [Bacteroidaceae bacterium]|nr:excinuclease ABC subunit UvrC [Bacteroidaceae bacterium]
MEKRAGEERLNYLKTIVDRLPEEPGSYQYWDETGTIIYVGKAKNLKKRVASYFNKNQESIKTRMLVSKIQDISYTTVRTEEDALNLENKLIKKYKPRYNVMLKDDKTYPSIAIPETPFPRVYKTRQTDKKHVTYYGPYTFVGALNNVMGLIKHLYPLRTCNLNLTKENIEAGKFKVCLEYHMGNCKGPCIGKQSEEEYMKNVEEVREILKGNTRKLEKYFLLTMKKLAEELRFEEAEILKQRLLTLQNFNAKSEVVNYRMDNIDVFSIEEDEEHKSAFINFMHVKNGCINQSFTFEYKRRLDETSEELLTLGISEMRERFGSKAKEIIVPFHVEMEMNNATFTVPVRGDKKKLLDLSILNVKEYKKDRIQQEEKLNPEQRAVRLLKELQDLLHLEKLPIRIECFDNSNIQGANPVAGCVVFIKGKPSKNDYRKYNIKTVIGPDDYASMREVVYRKYARAIEEETPLPDLIITDGGKGQMGIVKEVLDELKLDIPIAGLAKDDKHRTNELLFGFPPQTIGMKQDSALFHLLTRIQDEVHRFAITFHREKRSKHQISSELDNIKGIGSKTKETLLKHFKSVKRIKEADKESIAEIVGNAKAGIIKAYFDNNIVSKLS